VRVARGRAAQIGERRGRRLAVPAIQAFAALSVALIAEEVSKPPLRL